jgi:hypothetical protein
MRLPKNKISSGPTIRFNLTAMPKTMSREIAHLAMDLDLTAHDTILRLIATALPILQRRRAKKEEEESAKVH